VSLELEAILVGQVAAVWTKFVEWYHHLRHGDQRVCQSLLGMMKPGMQGYGCWSWLEDWLAGSKKAESPVPARKPAMTFCFAPCREREAPRRQPVEKPSPEVDETGSCHSNQDS
jgi:hypothetical protein